MQATSIHAAALHALMIADPDDKCRATQALLADWRAGRLAAVPGADDAEPVVEAGRPPRPELVAPQAVPLRKAGTREGHAALLHAIAHIEFNAINLALDCVHRFRALPADFHDGWLVVAAEEAHHFGLVRARLRALGFEYGDFPAHNGLWEMAAKTAHDALARMALVPRVLEARELDATPPIMARLKAIGDTQSVAVLEIILRDEIGHVALGDRWFRLLCAERGLEPEATYLRLIEDFDAPRPRPPLHLEARRAAGFSEAELARFGAPGETRP
ncbi:ferritin-like domain-containing protein [Pseudothauera nasutitermitis]|uniref:Ferritin-like domain-containing protein n=1 Tax=Pseudothauera nasutitermitis TaxID=2565930 RepID=A0A4S4AT69_9RHOO|nr:ferritin-like domain-containing protein [Pseudothauera nasutitermitis]THF62359.1 ferritin-like domain-containing protein [Pseudothauera nasutitermitis]